MDRLQLRFCLIDNWLNLCLFRISQIERTGHFLERVVMRSAVWSPRRLRLREIHRPQRDRRGCCQ
jgi:hypothetical protein